MIPVLVVLYQFYKRLRLILQSAELRGMLLFVVVLLSMGALFYHRVEGWSFLDALYFSVVTLTTIGYGDLTPQTAAGKMFTMMYIFLGLGVLAVFISSVSEQTLEEERRRWAHRKDTITEALPVVEKENSSPVN